MSYDLTAYFTPVPGNFKKHWEAALAAEGLPLEFAEDFDPHDCAQAELIVTWKQRPTLIELPAEETETFLPYCEMEALSAESRAARDSQVPLNMRREVSGMTHFTTFTSSAGRSSNGLVLQIFLVATLAKVFGGVVFDPQERGYISADEALAYGRETIAQQQAEEGTKERKRADRHAEIEEDLELLDTRWRWFKAVLFGACAAWLVVAGSLFAVDAFKLSITSGFVPLVMVVLPLAAIFFSHRATRYFFETMDYSWPMPWFLGIVAAIPLINILVFFWARKKYAALLVNYRLLKERV